MITIRQGDVTDPIWKDTNQVIIHCVNDENCMGAGVALALLKKWPVVKGKYHEWALQRPNTFKLGQVQFVTVQPATSTQKSIEVVNLIGQRGMGWTNFNNLGVKIPAARLEALYEGFLRVRSEVKSRFTVGTAWKEHTFHLPLLSHGLAGGDFEITFQKYLEAFRGTESRTCFYAYSNEDWEYLQKIYNKYFGFC